ncbi:MAG: DoxX family protein [Parcubacteria group bacterium GW2011_GWA2_44_12]|nr:MAG: DoxX family protein [Parcubacteria group bacterium GW2011_GWA2_44_12]
MNRNTRARALFFLIASLFAPSVAFAHVGYVIDRTDQERAKGIDLAFLFTAFHEYKIIALVLIACAVFLLLCFLASRHTTAKAFIKKVQIRGSGYEELIPWMLRLSVGIGLVGAGTSKVFISPSLNGFPEFAFIQTFLGFLILLGFLLSPALILAFFLFLWAFVKTSYMLGNIDFLAACMAIFALASSRPGLDHLLGIPFFPKILSLKNYVPLILRIGIGGAMIYLAFQEKMFNPHLSALVVEKFHLTDILPVSPALWVLGTGMVELAIGAAFLLGLYTRFVSAFAFIMLSLSFFYFGEDVYAHITLFAILSVLFITGAGNMSADTWKSKA